MKKLLILILSIGLIFSGLSVSATEASEFSAEMSYDKENNRYIISGTVAGDMGNVPMTLSVLKSNGDFYTGLQTLAKRNGEKIEFKFDALNFPTDAATDTYALCVSSEFFTQTQTFSLPIFSVEDQFGFLKTVNGYIENGGTGICASAKANAKYLGLSETDFQLGEEAVEVFDTFITVPYDIPAEFNSGNADGINKISIAWKRCCVDFFEALAAAELVDIETASDCSAWITQYYTALNLDKENAETAYSENKINEYFDLVKGTSAFLNKMKAITELANTSDIVNSVNEAILLSAIETMKYTAVSDIFTSFPQLFDVDDDLYSELTSAELGNIYTEMAGNSYSSYLTAVADFNKLAKEKIENRGSGDNDGGSSNKSGNGGKVFVPAAPADDEASDVNDVNELSDLNEAEWAREAVTYLVSKNIINGRGNGKFEPNADITRAEFIKIVVMALGLQAEAGPSFNDVNPSSWYAPTVCAAKSAGIIFGDDNNNFNPDDNISRQDMATILYRAYNIRNDGVAGEFTDHNEISDYAKDAVSALSGKGIINGMGDGSFAPLANATRAQAAQVIYKIIK